MLKLPIETGALSPLDVRSSRGRRFAANAPADAVDGPFGDTPAPGVSLSEPLTIPLDEKLAARDLELEAFWNAQAARFAFDYVTFRCEFQPASGEPIENAWIRVQLNGPASAQPPLVWSMTPVLESDQSKLTSSANIGAEFKLLKAGISGEEETQVERWFVRARGEQTDRSFWEFQDNGISRIDGTFRLNLVVRRPLDAEVTGTISGSVTVAKRSFLLFKSRESRSGSAMTFHLPAAA
jgi:hypothetical protein